MDRLSHLNKMRAEDGRNKKLATESTTQPNKKYKSPKDYPDFKQAFKPN